VRDGDGFSTVGFGAMQGEVFDTVQDMRVVISAATSVADASWHVFEDYKTLGVPEDLAWQNSCAHHAVAPFTLVTI